MAARPAPMPRRKTLLGDHPVCSSQSMEDSYESGDVIGTGSFGIIRKVTRRVDGRVLARKELNYGRMDERDLKQLTEEVNILEQLGSNDNIVRYYERFVDKPKNMLYILMEYCEGGDLAGVIQRCRKTNAMLPEDVVWAYLTQITLALHDCHSEIDSKGQRKPVILHRDIKPENVFLDKENNLKLGDFGLSKAMAQAAMTQTYVGTPYYMSPELINGQPYDVKSDIWALGCLIYELCAGHPPFHEARTQPELAVMIREGKIPDLPKPYTPHLGQVVRAMLKQNPKHRPNTAQIKALDTVRLQIRALELRKATRELRLRDALVAERENDLLAREAAVLAREQAVLLRENNVRAAADAVKEAEARLAEAEASNAGHGLPFPRISSSSSLMSLDDTPIKMNPASLRRRLASKSMHDLTGGGSISTPTRTVSMSEALRAVADRSPITVSTQASPLLSAHPAPLGSLEPAPNSGLPPTRHLSSPALPPATMATQSAPPTAAIYDDDVPSPFLKKPVSVASSRITSAPPSRSSSKPPILSRLLATRAHAAQASGGAEEQQQQQMMMRRPSAARKSLGV
ncbi:hypothetical protein JCM1841_003175 [Sporobolomyces salmonicolor]